MLICRDCASRLRAKQISSQSVGWAKRSVPTIYRSACLEWWARFALPTLRTTPACELADRAGHATLSPINHLGTVLRRKAFPHRRPHHLQLAPIKWPAAGTIALRAYWSPDTITFGKRHYEKSRDLSGSRRKCASRDGRIRSTAFPECSGRSGEQRSKRPHGL